MTQINVKVKDSVKREWEEYIEEEAEVNTKSALIRLAVQEYISESKREGSGVSEEVMEEINEGQQQILRELDSVRDKVEIIRNEVVRDSKEMRDIAYSVLEHIPRVAKQGKIPAEIVDDDAGKPLTEFFRDRPKPLISFSDLVEESDYDERNVKKAINVLLEDNVGVDKTEYNGKEVYWRV